jgi:hypothetical protein
MGTGLDEHLRLCRVDVDNQLAEVTEQARRVLEAIHGERQAADERMAELRTLELLDSGARGMFCPCCDKRLSLCLKHGLYPRTDENQCPACRRGE